MKMLKPLLIFLDLCINIFVSCSFVGTGGAEGVGARDNRRHVEAERAGGGADSLGELQQHDLLCTDTCLCRVYKEEEKIIKHQIHFIALHSRSPVKSFHIQNNKNKEITQQLQANTRCHHIGGDRASSSCLVLTQLLWCCNKGERTTLRSLLIPASL